MSEASDPRASGPAPPRWPPPGLERIQGDLYGLAARAALAGVFLVLPLLFLVTRDVGFATLGPLADAWWLTLALGTVGLAFGLDALAWTGRLLARSGAALARGHDGDTVLRVLADRRRDMGFLLSGARHFSLLDAVERQAIARLRVVTALLLAAGGLWLALAFSVGLFLASRGILTPLRLELITVAPAVGAYLFGGVAYLAEERPVRRSRREWHSRPDSGDRAMEEVRIWRQSMADAGHALTSPEGSPEPRGRALRLGGVGVAVAAVVLVMPVLTLIPASAIGPVLTTVSAPSFDVYRPRAARAEAYRSYAIDGDLSITPEEAGRILQTLTFAGGDIEPGAGELPPARRVSEPWIPGAQGDNPLGLDPFAWGDSLMERVEGGVGPEQRAFLRDVADHPLMGEFSRLARATALDAASGRWQTPLPPGLTMATLPVPSFGALRSAANAHIGAAALAWIEGRTDDAEGLLAEVVSVGFLLADDGPTLIDNLVGYAIVESGGAALADFFRISGQPAAAAELSRLRQVADRAAAMMEMETPRGSDAWVRSMPDMILDTTLVRGLRWEYFINLATMAPCLNINRIVFGAGDEYDAFVEEARQRLVRWPSEEPLFELARHGWVGTADPAPPGILGRFAGLYMSSGENSCTRALSHVQGSGF